MSTADTALIWKNEQEKLSTKCVLIDSEVWQIKFNQTFVSNLEFCNDDSNIFHHTNLKCIRELDTLNGEFTKGVGDLNDFDTGIDIKDLNYVAGLDISYIKESKNEACVAVIILDFPQLNVIYEDISMVKLSNEYIPGFLSYREAPGLIYQLENVIASHPNLKPQLVFVDGNGILHPRKFGLACQIGLHFDMPCIGVAKNLYHVDGLENDINHKNRISYLKKNGDSFPLIGITGTLYGYALRSTDNACNPIYVSPGHKISLPTSLRLTHACCKFRVPEPIRQADMRSREYLRQSSYVKINGNQNKNHKNKFKEKKFKEDSSKDIYFDLDLSNFFQ